MDYVGPKTLWNYKNHENAEYMESMFLLQILNFLNYPEQEHRIAHDFSELLEDSFLGIFIRCRPVFARFGRGGHNMVPIYHKFVIATKPTWV